MTNKRSRRSFGAIRQLPSGNFQASFVHPLTGTRVKAPYTFSTKRDADSWLAIERRNIILGDFSAPQARRDSSMTYAEFATQWLEGRELTPGTLAGYQSTLANWLLPTFGNLRLAEITRADVNEWHRKLGNRYPTARANAYILLNASMRAAIDHDLIAANPCNIKGAGNPKVRRQGELLSPAELEQVAAEMPERYRLFIPLAGYGALRIGEAAGLQVGDFDLKNNEVSIRRASTDIGPRIGPTKTESSIRTVALPAQLVRQVEAHVENFCEAHGKAWLFPSPSQTGMPVQPQVLRRYLIIAAEASGHPDFRPHDLRRTGATLAAQAGATTREVMARLGHTSATVAMKYQLSTRQRDRAIAERLGGNDAQ